MAFITLFTRKRSFVVNKPIIIIGSLLGAFSLTFGALGSHLLEPYLISIGKMDTYQTAVQYQFYHVFLILFIGIVYNYSHKHIINYAFYACLLGVLLFSGSLYILCLTNQSMWGLLTPFGGLSLLISWVLLFLSFIKK